MIKGRSPFPFETIAVAVSFSTGLDAVIAEAKRICYLHGALAVFIHAGKKTSDKHRRLGNVLSDNGFHDGNSRIYWEQAGDAASLLQVCRHEVVDLLLAGCSDKENFQLPTGRFATELATRAKCSVLLFCNQTPNGSFENIHVNLSDHLKTEYSISTGLYLAEKEKSAQLVLVDDVNDSGDGLVQVENTQSQRKLSSPLRTALEHTSVNVMFQNSGGLSPNDFAFRNKADLLILNSADHHLRIFDRIFSDSMEKALLNPSCHLLIVHSRLQD